MADSRFMMPSRHGKTRGFVITTTMVLVFTVVFIGVIVGVAAVRNAWFKKAAFETSVDVYVSDQNGVVLGKAVDFDEHEAPLIPFVDYDVPENSNNNYRVLVGIRDDRFTSREKLYYTSDNCTLGAGETACMFDPSTETSGNATINSQDVDKLLGTGGVSYQVATQGDINYAIGSSDGGLPGRLYRQTETVCDTTTTQNIRSFWMSQAVVWQQGTDTPGGTPLPGPGEPHQPCYQLQFFEQVLYDRIRCQPGAAIASNRCLGPSEVGAGEFHCRVWEDECSEPGQGQNPPDPNWGGPGFGACPLDPNGNWVLTPPNNNSGWCCPPGSGVTNGGAGQCQQISNYLPTDGTFYQAESVGGTPNILDALLPPFLVNTPINPNEFSLQAPAGE